jgi:hypothetical protein
MKPLKKGPSPALIVAVAAMAFALVGTAVAANDGSIYPKLSKSKVKKIAKKQATKQLKANVNNSHVNLADVATDAENLGGNPPGDFQKKGLTAFTAATLTNNWTRFAPDWSEPGYWVDEDGIVNIQGSLDGGTSPAAFALPAGVRPTTWRSYVIRCSGGPGQVEINPTTGNVSIFNYGGSNCATYAFLDGITFRPDN